MAKRILALDLATKTGFAHSCGQSGVWDLSIGRDESSGMRLIRFEGKLNEIHKSIGVDVIVFEEVSASRGLRADLNVVKLATKLQAVIERWCIENGVEHCSRNIQTIKAYAMPIVKGKKQVRDKDGMFAAAKLKWPDREFLDDNEVDACWLLDLVQKELVA
jgi:hypothetical protein